MADHKYYWIKLKDTMFTSDAIDFLMGQPNGANYVVLYQMLCLKTANTNGEFYRQIGEVIIPYDIDKIQRDCKYFDRDTIIVALELYKKLNLIYTNENGNLQIANFDNLVGSEWTSAERVKLFRERQKALQCNTNVTPNVTQDNRYKILENRDKDINNIGGKNVENFPPTHTKKFVKPTIPEIRAYCLQNNIRVDAERFFNYYESKGWVVGKAPMKNWHCALANWAKENRDNGFAERQYTESEMNSVFTDLNNYDDIEL